MVRRRRLSEQHVTEGDAGIVGAENDVQAPPCGPFASLKGRRWYSAFLEVYRELVVMVAHRPVVIDWIFPGRIVGLGGDAGHGQVAVKRGSAVKLQPKRRIGQQFATLERHLVIRPDSRRVGSGKAF